MRVDDKMTIVIPTTVEKTRALFCMFHPPTGDAKVTYTLDGESTPFREAKIYLRSNEIAAYMFRPVGLDGEKQKRIVHLKSGDEVNVTVTLNGTTNTPETKTQKVTIE